MSGHKVRREDWNGNFLLSGRGDGKGDTEIGRLWGYVSGWNGSFGFFPEDSEPRALLYMVKVLWNLVTCLNIFLHCLYFLISNALYLVFYYWTSSALRRGLNLFLVFLSWWPLSIFWRCIALSYMNKRVLSLVYDITFSFSVWVWLLLLNCLYEPTLLFLTLKCLWVSKLYSCPSSLGRLCFSSRKFYLCWWL